jgi:Cys-rich protein (TIGR01571 family)
MSWQTSLTVYVVLWITVQVVQHYVNVAIAPMLFGKTAEGSLTWQAESLSNVTKCVLGFVFAYFIWDLRSKFRAKFSIPGSDGTDFICGWCCSCCTLAQMDRHLQLNKVSCRCDDPGPNPGLADLEAPHIQAFRALVALD